METKIVPGFGSRESVWWERFVGSVKNVGVNNKLLDVIKSFIGIVKHV